MKRLFAVGLTALLVVPAATAVSLSPATSPTLTEPWSSRGLNQRYSWPSPLPLGVCGYSALGGARVYLPGGGWFASGRTTLSPPGGVLGAGYCAVNGQFLLNIEQELLVVSLDAQFVRFRPRFLARVSLSY